MIDVVVVWPTPSELNAPPGLKVYVPSAFSVKVPPLEPATAVPTPAALPLTCDTLSASPSGSTSLPSTPSVRWSTTSTLSCDVAPLSSVAIGSGLPTFHRKVCVTDAPDLSVAVTVIRYSPFTPVLVWSDAQFANVPVNVPVAVSNVRPPGMWSTEYVRTSPASISLNAPATLTVTVSPSMLSRLSSAMAVGASLVPVISTVSVAELKPPSPSETVYVIEDVVVWPAASELNAEPGLKV